jgi:Protein of unknown function (DUF1360)
VLLAQLSASRARRRDRQGEEPRGEAPRPEYVAISAAFGTVLGGFLLLGRRRLPERIGFADVARVGLASYKLGRVVAKDEVTSWVRAPVTRDEEATEPKPRGMERALGELVTCPYCLGLWIASGLSYSLVLFPRQTRLVTTIFGAQAVADFLNAAFLKLQDD